MSAARQRRELEIGSPPPAGPALRPADTSDEAHASPARSLQSSVEAAYVEPRVEAWPAPIPLLITVGASAGLWAVIGAVAVKLLRF